MTNSKVKEVLKNIKKKWFIYFLILVVVALVWGIYYGRLVETPPEKVLYVWVTPCAESDTSTKSGEDINQIIEVLDENYKDWGFKKFKPQTQSLSNNDELLNYNIYTQFDVDISILPIEYFEQNTSFTQVMDLQTFDLPAGVTYFEGLNYEEQTIKVAIKLNSDYAMSVSLNYSMPEGVIEQILDLILDTI